MKYWRFNDTALKRWTRICDVRSCCAESTKAALT